MTPIVTDEPTTPRRGRPPGSTTKPPLSPDELLRREMTETSKVSSEVRELMEKQLDAIRKKMDNPNTSTDDIIKLGAILPEILEALTKNVAMCGKLLVPRDEPSTAGDDLSGDDILAEMTGGGSKRKTK